MKKILIRIIVAIICMLSVSLGNTQAQPSGAVSFQVFYDNLSPYGQWISDPQYGYVWAPSGIQGFRPYFTGGHWIMTDFGTTWVSDYPWGWAPFHYGRWVSDPFYGWVWVPGNEWGPAWVEWGSAPGYYGWAPLGPGVSFSVAFGPSYHVPYDWWVFIPPHHLCDPHFHQYYYGPHKNLEIIKQTTVIKNTYVNNHVTYISGPRPQEVEMVTHQKLAIYKVGNENRPGKTVVENNQVSLYRPSVENAAHPAKPANFKAATHPIGKSQSVQNDKNNAPGKSDAVNPQKNVNQDGVMNENNKAVNQDRRNVMKPQNNNDNSNNRNNEARPENNDVIPNNNSNNPDMRDNRNQEIRRENNNPPPRPRHVAPPRNRVPRHIAPPQEQHREAEPK